MGDVAPEHDVRAERLNSPNAKVRRIAELEVEVERLREELRLAEADIKEKDDAIGTLLDGSSDPCDIAHTYERDPE